MFSLTLYICRTSESSDSISVTEDWPAEGRPGQKWGQMLSFPHKGPDEVETEVRGCFSGHAPGITALTHLSPFLNVGF